MEQNATKPVKTFRDGAVGASIWLRQSPTGTFYDVTLSRSWKDETGKTGYAQSFSDYHLDALAKLAMDAKAWIANAKGNAQMAA